MHHVTGQTLGLMVQNNYYLNRFAN